jgi:hypothetical protein
MPCLKKLFITPVVRDTMKLLTKLFYTRDSRVHRFPRRETLAVATERRREMRSSWSLSTWALGPNSLSISPCLRRQINENHKSPKSSPPALA